MLLFKSKVAAPKAVAKVDKTQARSVDVAAITSMVDA
jgi:hypothetical protein